MDRGSRESVWESRDRKLRNKVKWENKVKSGVRK